MNSSALLLLHRVFGLFAGLFYPVPGVLGAFLHAAAGFLGNFLGAFRRVFGDYFGFVASLLGGLSVPLPCPCRQLWSRCQSFGGLLGHVVSWPLSWFRRPVSSAPFFTSVAASCASAIGTALSNTAARITFKRNFHSVLLRNGILGMVMEYATSGTALAKCNRQVSAPT